MPAEKALLEANQVKHNPFRFKGAAAPIRKTGNTLIQFKPGVSTSDAVKLLRRGNRPVATMSDYKSNRLDLWTESGSTDIFVLDQLGVAMLRQTVEQPIRAQELKKDGLVAEIIPEFYVFSYVNIDASEEDDDDDGIHEDTEDATWGVLAVGATRCSLTGRGIKVAILDSGFDGVHPDFDGRNVQYWSAFGDSANRDILGHGTHCTGTAGASSKAFGTMRYGIAPEADLRIYKVLDDTGTGGDFTVLAGIERALADGCHVLSMSFGRGAEEGTSPNPLYERAARSALDRGCLFIAAAGNSSSRDLGYIAPVDYPANSPSVLAVAAVDSRLKVSNFSCGEPVGGGRVDIAAPGAGVLSSVPMPRKYRRLRAHPGEFESGFSNGWKRANLRLLG